MAPFIQSWRRATSRRRAAAAALGIVGIAVIGALGTAPLAIKLMSRRSIPFAPAQDDQKDAPDDESAPLEVNAVDDADPPHVSGRVVHAHADSPSEDPNTRMLREHLALLKVGREQFLRFPSYQATLFERERLGPTLTDGVTLRIKIRHQPFSLYMKWVSGQVGKELLYVDGAEDNRMLVRLGGFKGRLLPLLRLDPLGSLAMSESRHPVTMIGIVALAESLITHREREFQDHVLPRARQEADADCSGRRCRVFVFEFGDHQKSAEYRKSIQHIDYQWNVPLRVANYAWPDLDAPRDAASLDEATLIEYYSYSEIDAGVQLTDGDFDRSNDEYHFRR